MVKVCYKKQPNKLFTFFVHYCKLVSMPEAFCVAPFYLKECLLVRQLTALVYFLYGCCLILQLDLQSGQMVPIQYSRVQYFLQHTHAQHWAGTWPNRFVD